MTIQQISDILPYLQTKEQALKYLYKIVMVYTAYADQLVPDIWPDILNTYNKMFYYPVQDLRNLHEIALTLAGQQQLLEQQRMQFQLQESKIIDEVGGAYSDSAYNQALALIERPIDSAGTALAIRNNPSEEFYPNYLTIAEAITRYRLPHLTQNLLFYARNPMNSSIHSTIRKLLLEYEPSEMVTQFIGLATLYYNAYSINGTSLTPNIFQNVEIYESETDVGDDDEGEEKRGIFLWSRKSKKSAKKEPYLFTPHDVLHRTSGYRFHSLLMPGINEKEFPDTLTNVLLPPVNVSIGEYHIHYIYMSKQHPGAYKTKYVYNLTPPVLSYEFPPPNNHELVMSIAQFDPTHIQCYHTQHYTEQTYQTLIDRGINPLSGKS